MIARMPTQILVVDNFDSFVYNLVQYLQQLGAQVVVRRNDAVTVDEARGFDGILLSPGPGTPERAGVCVDLVKNLAGDVPLFGVCLGLQAMAVAFGATVDRAPELLHGKTSLVEHDGRGVFDGLPSPMIATRYHSLAVVPETLPDVFEVHARTAPTEQAEAGVIMGIRHRVLPVESVQFHPESVLTQGGHRMLANWLGVCGDPGAVARSAGLAPVVPAAAH
jgi:para-aminobenzoate synthetase component II